MQKKLLAINFGGLGDEILFLPTLKSIKKNHPNWHVTLLTEPRAKSITQITHLIDKNVTFDIKKKPLLITDLIKLLTILWEGNYNIVISSGSSAFVAMLLFLSGIKHRVGYDSGLLSRLLLTSAVCLKRNQYAAYMYHDLVKGLGINKLSESPEILPSQDSCLRMAKLMKISDSNKLRVLIHPGASKLSMKKGMIKTWHSDNWSWLVNKLTEREEVQVILCGGPEDKDIISAITQAIGHTGHITSTLLDVKANAKVILAHEHTQNLSDLVALIQLCDLMVCVDSAPMHLAVALKKCLVVLFGPTNPANLILDDEHFLVLKESNYKASAHAAPKTESSKVGIAIPRETVLQAIVNQLNLISRRENFQKSQQ